MMTLIVYAYLAGFGMAEQSRQSDLTPAECRARASAVERETALAKAFCMPQGVNK